jgi:hypothetical protein
VGLAFVCQGSAFNAGAAEEVPIKLMSRLPREIGGEGVDYHEILETARAMFGGN